MNKKTNKKHTYKYNFPNNPYPGLFVVLEGLDGSGNSTQAKRIAAEIENQDVSVLLTKEPTSGPVGAMIRMVLENRLEVDLQTLQMMFTVDRADHIRGDRGIVRYLKKGNVVISDRYLTSTLAFGFASGLDIEWLLAMQSKFFLPDKTYFLNVDPKVCIERIKKARPGFDLFEKEKNLEKVMEGYNVARKLLSRRMKVIDGEDRIEIITKKILTDLKKSRKYKDVTKYAQQRLLKES